MSRGFWSGFWQGVGLFAADNVLQPAVIAILLNALAGANRHHAVVHWLLFACSVIWLAVTVQCVLEARRALRRPKPEPVRLVTADDHRQMASALWVAADLIDRDE